MKIKCIENWCCDELLKVNKLIILCDQLIYETISKIAKFII